jgi:hypothetical protein
MNAPTRIACLFVALIAFVFFSSSVATSPLPQNFTDLLDRAGLVFQSPDSLVSTPVIYSHACSYEYAVKYPHKNFEVRYAIRPSDNLWKEYELNKKSIKKGDIETNPDSTFLSAFETIILNTSGSLPKITEFDKASVKSEFNADWGGTVAFQPRQEFSQKYKYCMIIALHKSHQGDAYIFFLSDSTEGFNELMAPAFHSLRFK